MASQVRELRERTRHRLPQGHQVPDAVAAHGAVAGVVPVPLDREQLQLESADNAANKQAIAAQAEMLDVLSRQQAQILAELQRLRPGSETAVVPGLGW